MFVKLLVLAVVSAVGMWAFTPHRLEPLSNLGVGGLFVGAGSIFVAYEGFELLSYDYDDIEDPERNLPRALYLSVAVVVAVYVIVTLGSQMLVSDQVIVSQREVAFATVGQEALGGIGRALAVGAAVLATSSAINATLFSTSRLVRDLTQAGELPPALGRTTRGLPVTAMALLAVRGRCLRHAAGDQRPAGVRFARLPRRVRFGQPLVRPHRRSWREGVSGHVGSASCAGAIGVVLFQLATTDPAALGLVGGLTTAVLILRLVWRRHSASGGGSVAAT